MRKILSFILLMLSLQHVSAQQLRVGAARVSITPSSEIFPVKPAHEQHAYVGVHDSVFVRAIVIEQNRERAVLLCMDEVKVIAPQRTAQAAAKAAGTAESQVFSTCSHTHGTLHGEIIPEDFYVDAATEAVRRAVSALTPAVATYGEGEAAVNMNNGEIRGLQYDTHGYSDHTLSIVRFSALDSGQNIALLVSFASHAEVMFRSVSRDGGYEVSGDLPGRVSYLSEHSPKGAPVTLCVPGAEGDQLPLFQGNHRTQEQGGVDQGAGGWSLVDALARRVFDSVVWVQKRMEATNAPQALRTATTQVLIPGQRWNRHTASGKPEAVDTPDVPVELGVIQLGDILITGIGADIASKIGTEIRRSTENPHTLLFTMLGDSKGYILEDKAYENPGHGVMGSPVKPGYAQDRIIQGLTSILNK